MSDFARSGSQASERRAEAVARHEVCPHCGAALKSWRTKTDKGREYPIDRCDGCGFAFVNPRPSREFLREFYEVGGHGQADAPTLPEILRREAEYPNSTVDAARFAKRARAMCPFGRAALDVGCGYGFVSQAATAQGFEVTSLEVASVERAVAAELLGKAPLAVSFEEFEAPPASFDVVFMSQVLEHALDPDLWVAAAVRLLKPGGVLVVALPNFGSLFRLVMQEREPYICPPAHLNFFDERSLSQLLVKHGLQVRNIEFVSRLSGEVLTRRLRRAGRPVVALAKRAAPLLLSAIDRVGRGQMVNVYARA